MSFIAFASRAKGPRALLRRIGKINNRYGLTAHKMEQSLDLFAQVLERFDCGATFPLTAVALQRNRDAITKYLNGKIEFAIHGYTHIDYSRLAPDVLQAHLRQANDIFAAAGIPVAGFRSPYLRRGKDLYAALQTAGVSYVSNQPILWAVLDRTDFDGAGNAGYERAIAFYEPWDANAYLSLPRISDGLLEIPVSLPDDEILLDRMEGRGTTLVERTWNRILSQAYQRGELFVLQLHPERITLAAEALGAVLSSASILAPSVWMASLQDIAAWWKARTATKVQISDGGDGRFSLQVDGPRGVTILLRGVESEAETVPWADGYSQVRTTDAVLHVPLRPFIGVAPDASPALVSFLQQQGYIVESGLPEALYACYFVQKEFSIEHERSIVEQIEGSEAPLVKLGRWPDGARCALSVTGDIDGLTIWDYVLRILGK